MEDQIGVKPEIILKEGYKLEDVPDEFPEGLIEEFKRNIVWVSLCKLVDEHLVQLRKRLETCAPSLLFYFDPLTNITSRVEGVEYYQGAVEECENFKTLPDRLLKPKEIKDEPTE